MMASPLREERYTALHEFLGVCGGRSLTLQWYDSALSGVLTVQEIHSESDGEKSSPELTLTDPSESERERTRTSPLAQ